MKVTLDFPLTRYEFYLINLKGQKMHLGYRYK